MFQRKSIVYAAVVAVLLITAVFGAFTVSAQTPPPTTPMTGTRSMGAADSSAPFDARFIDAMVVHHEGAVVMAEEALARSQQPDLLALAKAIVAAQGPEIDQMRAWRQEWYPDLATTPGMDMSMGDMAVSDDETVAYDQRFLVAMISHHQGAINMAEQALANAEHDELKTLAEGIIVAQQAEIDQMRVWLAEWFAVIAEQPLGHGMMGGTTPMTGTHPMGDMGGMQMDSMQMGQMMQMMGQMMQMMGQMQSMMGSQMMGQSAPSMMGGAAPITGAMPMSGAQSVGPMGGPMQQMDSMQMMGQMMQMMGQMHGLMGSQMMGQSAPITGAMPMSGAQSVGPMGGPMQQMDSMQMMDQMMQMMGQMHGSTMGGAGMGQSGAMTGRQVEVAERGAQVMPFDLEQTLHIFTNLDNGGLQQVIVKEGSAPGQVRLIQMHLSQQAEKFRLGNFDDPAQIHGNAMPGLAVLRERASEIDVQYTPLDNGGQIEYTSDDPDLIAAIHDWFDAQIADHGPHAAPAQPAAAQLPAKTEQTPQSIEGGGVTVKVTPPTLTDKTATSLDFEVVLDTHSVELNYDVAQLSLLRDNLGNEYKPSVWTPEQSGGHHVSGLLSFADRTAILQTGVTSLELDVTGIAGIPSRIFQWTVGE